MQDDPPLSNDNSYLIRNGDYLSIIEYKLLDKKKGF